jgi:hypothetical protein
MCDSQWMYKAQCKVQQSPCSWIIGTNKSVTHTSETIFSKNTYLAQRIYKISVIKIQKNPKEHKRCRSFCLIKYKLLGSIRHIKMNGECHSIKHKSNQPHSMKQSLTELKVTCAITGELGKPTSQPCHLIPTHQKKSWKGPQLTPSSPPPPKKKNIYTVYSRI